MRDDPLYYDRHGRQWRTSAHPFFNRLLTSIYVINAAAITKPQQLSTDINSYNVDIAAVTETHLKNKHTDSIVAIPRYTLLRRDRLRHKGGGVALYVRSSLSVSLWTFSADNRLISALHG